MSASSALCQKLVDALEDIKGHDIKTLDVTDLTTITDYMVLVSGTSNRHVKAMVDEVIEAAKAHGDPPLGIEGRESNEWVLLDVGDVIVHVMQKETREFYDLERLWSELPADSETRQP
ncbi:MAG: ribosome silencing factor [Pseudomonadales bacterium]